MPDSEPISAEERFSRIYKSGPAWEIHQPQPVICRLFREGLIGGRVLDAGCGSGQNAVWLARQGCEVVAFDFIDEPLREAKALAASANVNVEFRKWDALRLDEWTERFDTAIDSGLYHVFPDSIRWRYVAGLRHVLVTGGRLHLICFSDRQPGTEGPLRISRGMLESDFAGPAWRIDTIEECRYGCQRQPGGPQHDGQGALAWRMSACAI